MVGGLQGSRQRRLFHRSDGPTGGVCRGFLGGDLDMGLAVRYALPMHVTPIYKPENLSPAYQLRFSWTGFPKRGTVLPTTVPLGELDELLSAWEADGIRLLEHRWQADKVQATVSLLPHVSPSVLAARTKGRIQYVMRERGLALRFARHFSVRSLGDTTREAVEGYVQQQVRRSGLIDPRYREELQRCTLRNPHIDLRKPWVTDSGLYWYNLHVVMVTAERYRMDGARSAPTVSDACRATAVKHNYEISTLSVMPDHVHIALRGKPADSPQEIALRFQNNTAWALGQIRFWEHNYYAGTFGEYTMHAVRRQ